MAKRQPKHLHIYKRKNIARKGNEPYMVLACIDVMCSHYIPLHLAEGKICACYYCKEAMVIDKKALTNVKIHCVDCTKTSNRSKPKLDLVGIIEDNA